MLKSDRWIRSQCRRGRMIAPFVEKQRSRGRVSYGLSSYGYDIRLADEYRVFAGRSGGLIDPKAPDPRAFRTRRGPFCVIPPHSFVLARSLEYFRIPRGVLAVCVGKSTYARCGIIVNVTPLEPCWTGYLTIEISNTAPLPVKIYSREGIAQLLFFEGDEICETSYADRAGKYQAQGGIAGPRVAPRGGRP